MTIRDICIKMDEQNASDLFLSVGRVPAMRQNGNVLPMPNTGELSHQDFVDFIHENLPAGTLERLEAEKDLDLSASLGSVSTVQSRFRCNLSFQRGLISMAIRRIPSGRISPASLHIPASVIALADAPRGLILVTGSTGSGKTTTLACLLNHINETSRRHIVTIEDPIEYLHSDDKSVISQREIGNDTKDFASALRHVVRQNPDAIFIGEMRDQETIQTAISAAMTGHLVAATMHTMDVPQTIERILSYYPEGMREQVSLDLSYVLVGIISQRLLPTADGKSRIPAFEILTSTPLAKRLIAKHDLVSLPELIKTSPNDGMLTFNQSLLKLCQDGIITVETASAFSPNKEELLLLLQGMKTGIDTLRHYSANMDEGLSLKKLLLAAVMFKASDMLLTAGASPTLRIDGVLRTFEMPIKGDDGTTQYIEMPLLAPGDTQKLLFSVLNATQRADFEEQREIDFALAIQGLDPRDNAEKEYRFRVNGYYQKGSIAAAFRAIPSVIPDPVTLGIPPQIMDLAKRQQGLVLVTGPTGSGKSTTLATIIQLINKTRPCHIITVEDPIEFVHTNQAAIIDQRELNSDTHSFANALKYVLRQDPDVILVGEMRDMETIATALTAAETGHLVFATLHTNDVTQSVDRIIDVFPADRQNQVRAQLAACLECIISQRLLPRVKPATNMSNAISPGRVAAYEILMANTAIKAMIRDKKTHQLAGMMENFSAEGMITMERAVKNLFDAGVISRETYISMMPRDQIAAVMRNKIGPKPF